MRVGILRSLAALLAATGVVTAQATEAGNGPALSGQMMSAAPAPIAPAGSFPSYSPLAHPDGWEPSGGCNCGYDDVARPTNQFYSSAELLVWNFRNDRLPRLASSVPVGLIQVPSVLTTSTVTGPGAAAATVPPPVTGPSNIFIPVSIVSTPT